jgi:23S rRNA (uracil1939-C5)-methyltransferase
MAVDGELHTIQVTTPTYGGDTLGRLPDGRAVFVPFTLPGETVRIRLVEEKRGFARAELIEVLTPSPERITPLCNHFQVCGGCHYQHLPYEMQLNFKTQIVRDQLERIGKIADPPVLPAVPSAQQYYYRNHVQFHLSPEGKLGYHKARSAEIFAIHECHLPEDALNSIWPLLDVEPVPGLERVSLRLGVDDDILLALESSQPEPPEFSVEDLPLSAVFLGGEEIHLLAGNDHVVIEVLERPFRVSAASFFQVNTPMAAAMVTHLLENLPLDPSATVIDAYAGAGLFSAFLAPRVERLIAIEISPSACADFETNLDEFDNVELYQAGVEEVLPGLQVEPQVILVDPPRAGIDRFAMDGIIALEPAILAYVSCDPATMARDARRLSAAGYRLEQITPFDLFPQTYHIESIGFWHKK